MEIVVDVGTIVLIVSTTAPFVEITCMETISALINLIGYNS